MGGRETLTAELHLEVETETPATDAAALTDRHDTAQIQTDGLPVPDVDTLGSSVTLAEPERVSPGLEEMFRDHYRALCRLATMLLRSTLDAEDVVSDIFADATIPGRLRDPDKMLAYLRQAVVNRSRSALRHRGVEEKHASKLIHGSEWDATAEGGIERVERVRVREAIWSLPDRQREAIVLRYYGDLSEAEVAAAMKVSQGTVKSHTSRGMAALRILLEQIVYEID